MPKPFVRDSEEFFKFTLTERDGQDLTTAVVQCAIEAPHTTSPTWIDCTWETGLVWRTNDPIVWSTTNYPPSAFLYQGWARVVDAPETPWVDLGPVPIKER